MNIDNLIMTTRIRLARNIHGAPFKAKDKKLFQSIANSIVSRNQNYSSYELSKLPELNSLFEQHIISKEFIDNADCGVIVTNKDNKVCVMIGEEDHIRAQVISNEFNFEKLYKTAINICNNLEIDFDIARNDRLGYLTACPTNLGGGMRASVMIYLPALTISKEITKIFEQVDNKKITIRGVYGEGSKSSGCIYQISNQNCINMPDSEILTMLKNIVFQITNAEINEQRKLWAKSSDKIIDNVMRAWGILTNAHLLSSTETMDHLIWIKLGSLLGIISFKNDKIIDDLFFITKPATLVTNNGINNDKILRDKVRAVRIREKLLSFRIK